MGEKEEKKYDNQVEEGSGVSESKMTDVDGPENQEEKDSSEIDEKNEKEDKETEGSDMDGGKGSNADEDEENEEADEEHGEDSPEKYKETSEINEEGEDYANEENNNKDDKNDWFNWNSDENADVGEDYAEHNHADNHDHARESLDVIHVLHTTDANFEIREHGDDYAEHGEEYEDEDANTDVQISTNKTRQTFYQSHIFPLHLLKELKKGIGEASIGEASTFTKESKCSDESMCPRIEFFCGHKVVSGQTVPINGTCTATPDCSKKNDDGCLCSMKVACEEDTV